MPSFSSPAGAGDTTNGHHHVMFLPKEFGGPRYFVIKKNVGVDFDYWHVVAEAPEKYQAQQIARALAALGDS